MYFCCMPPSEKHCSVQYLPLFKSELFSFLDPISASGCPCRGGDSPDVRETGIYSDGSQDFDSLIPPWHKQKIYIASNRIPQSSDVLKAFSQCTCGYIGSIQHYCST